MKFKIKGKGFTLIELMIVIAIVAILVALALPSYTRYVRKANRGEAQALLLNWANNQELWRANDTDYASVDELVAPTHTKYRFTLTLPEATTLYTLTATAQDDQANDEDKGTPCTALTLDQSNGKGPADCW